MSHVDRWHREVLRHPMAVDAAVALFCFGGTLAKAAFHPEGNDRLGWPLLVPLAAVAFGSLLFRRRWPRSVLAVTCATEGLYLLTGAEPNPMLAATGIAVFTVARNSDRHTAWLAGLGPAVAMTVAGILLQPGSWLDAQKWGAAGWIGLAAVAGESVRTRQAYVAAVEERAERAERTREEEARRRVVEERLRIARELHDVVAHHIALVNVQAGVVSHVMETRPDQAREALGHIRDASCSALEELRVTVGLLRTTEESAPTEPAPDLDRVEALADSFRKAGLPVTVLVEGSPRPVSAATGLAAYRVVQEAMTNAQKHAGPATVQVRIAYQGDRLVATVEDDGCGTPVLGQGPGTGHGIMGMRERAAALRGTLEAGPSPGGGFRVRLALPLPVRAEARGLY